MTAIWQRLAGRVGAQGWLVGLLLMGVAGGPSSPWSQPTLAALQRLELALWPEYDRAAVLVIYRFELEAEAPLPAAVALPIPASVAQPHAVAWQDANQVLYDARYTLRRSGNWQLVEVELLESRQGQLEYYADLAQADDRRSFRFEWPGGLAIRSVGVEVQQPPTASEFVIVPEPGRQSLGPFGFTYHLAELGSFSADTAWTLELSYRKPDALLSVEALDPLGAPAVAGEGTRPASAALPWLLGGLGLAALGVGVTIALRRRPAAVPIRRRRRGRSLQAAETPAPRFCHQCGTPAQPGDRYCRNCGTRLRTSEEQSS